MIEIVILAMLASKLGKVAESKGRKKIGYQLLLVGAWIGAEFFGAIVGHIIAAIVDFDSPMVIALALAYSCAAIAAVIVFQIVKALPPLESETDYYRAIDYADHLGAGERFGDRASRTPPVIDAVTDASEQRPPRIDERIQE